MFSLEVRCKRIFFPSPAPVAQSLDLKDFQPISGLQTATPTRTLPKKQAQTVDPGGKAAFCRLERVARALGSSPPSIERCAEVELLQGLRPAARSQAPALTTALLLSNSSDGVGVDSAAGRSGGARAAAAITTRRGYGRRRLRWFHRRHRGQRLQGLQQLSLDFSPGEAAGGGRRAQARHACCAAAPSRSGKAPIWAATP